MGNGITLSNQGISKKLNYFVTSPKTLQASFTPTDTANYTAASANVTITVLNATPTIAWNNQADITYGTALSGTQLNAVASVPGSFIYTPGNGTILSAGTKTLKVDFSPTDSANYTTASKNVSSSN